MINELENTGCIFLEFEVHEIQRSDLTVFSEGIFAHNSSVNISNFENYEFFRNVRKPSRSNLIFINRPAIYNLKNSKSSLKYNVDNMKDIVFLKWWLTRPLTTKQSEISRIWIQFSFTSFFIFLLRIIPHLKPLSFSSVIFFCVWTTLGPLCSREIDSEAKSRHDVTSSQRIFSRRSWWRETLFVCFFENRQFWDDN